MWGSDVMRERSFQALRNSETVTKSSMIRQEDTSEDTVVI